MTESQLRRLYAREPKRVAFVDEAYREGGEKPFYIVSAVVVQYEHLEAVRDDLLAIVETGYWHTTDAFKQDADPHLRKCLARIVARLAEDDAVTLCTVDAEPPHFADLEAVRAMALVSMAGLLAKSHEVDLMVYERRRAGERRDHLRRLASAEQFSVDRNRLDEPLQRPIGGPLGTPGEESAGETKQALSRDFEKRPDQSGDGGI